MGGEMEQSLRRSRRIAMLLAVIGLVAAACGSSSKPNASNSTTSAGRAEPETSAGPTPVEGGTVSFATRFAPNDLFPDTSPSGTGLGAVGPGIAEKLAIYDGLVAQGPDGETVYRIAKSLTSTDNITWTMTLEPGVTFSDGTALDAAAVKFNWDRVANPDTKSPTATFVAQLSSWDVVDATTLKITLKAANSQFPALLAGSGLTFIASPTALQSEGANFATKPVGAGAYVVTDWVKGSQLTLKRNRSYFGKTYLDSVVIKYVADDTQAYSTLASGGADIAYMQDVNTAAQAAATGYKVDVASDAGGYALEFNTTVAPFDDARARRAMALALDPGALNDAVFGGHSQAAVPLFPDGSPFHYAGAPQPAPNSTEAQKLFDALAAQGKPLNVSLLAISASQTQGIAEWIQATLASYKNVTVAVTPLATIELVKQLLGKSFQAVVFAIATIGPYPAFDNFFRTRGPNNYTGYSSGPVDAALQEARQTQDHSAQVNAYNTVQDNVARDLPAYFLVRLHNQGVYRQDVFGALPHFTSYISVWNEIWKKA
jgi:peptide/nickel transport system substrate-binding protein